MVRKQTMSLIFYGLAPIFLKGVICTENVNFKFNVPLLRSAYPVWDTVPISGKSGVGDPLILTPLIESKEFEKARDLALVKNLPGLGESDDIESYSGFFTVDEEHNSNLYFWFFPSMTRNENDPVLLWLQGGPGASSLYGLFEEIGPFSVTTDMKLKLNEHSWHRNHSLIFIDNPVGTGFSFTDTDAGYCENQEKVGEHLYSALIQFYSIFEKYKSAPFYITGESYAGKFIPTLAHTIHKKNSNNPDFKINLQGVAIGNGFTDPKTMLHYSDFVYQLGLVDSHVRDSMALAEKQSVEALKNNNTVKAYNGWAETLFLFASGSHFRNLYNFLSPDSKPLEDFFAVYLQTPEVRRALHVGDLEFTSIGKVYVKMVPDFMNSVQPTVEEVINNYRVLFYSGQMDIIVAYPLSVNLFENLSHSRSDEYKNATRRPWMVEEELAGYIKQAGNFTEVLVRNAGHMVPSDQPEWAYKLISDFTLNTLE
ncbi:hypothetical protein LSTR_LSTR002771 [Laodelphax striatellus]|uniref:Carboxypeptidase n=1 Tax=Laodelphax striatellus TaxID=195883 RepID=A0A482WMC2_LAOST|nr:hypothetical protein LSTR_LSTR002771 [Laodelphax striatellus]